VSSFELASLCLVYRFVLCPLIDTRNYTPKCSMLASHSRVLGSDVNLKNKPFCLNVNINHEQILSLFTKLGSWAMDGQESWCLLISVHIYTITLEHILHTTSVSVYLTGRPISTRNQTGIATRHTVL
jgi:hypothetical protein